MAQQDLDLGSEDNDGLGEGLRAGMNKVQSNFNELYGLKFGIYNYDNSLGTIAMSSSTWTHATNNGAGANTILTCAYPDVTPYDTTTSLFDFTDLEPCDSIDFRFDANITTSTANQVVMVRLLLSQGSLNIPLTFIINTFKNAGTYPLFGSVRGDILSTNVRDNPARFEVWSDASATLDVNGWNLRVHKIVQAR